MLVFGSDGECGTRLEERQCERQESMRIARDETRASVIKAQWHGGTRPGRAAGVIQTLIPVKSTAKTSCARIKRERERGGGAREGTGLNHTNSARHRQT